MGRVDDKREAARLAVMGERRRVIAQFEETQLNAILEDVSMGGMCLLLRGDAGVFAGDELTVITDDTTLECRATVVRDELNCLRVGLQKISEEGVQEKLFVGRQRYHRLQVGNFSPLVLVGAVILMTAAFLAVLVGLNLGGTADKTLELWNSLAGPVT